ncbi:BspA family leucine-rich repeat surface protein [Mycoplasma mycoides]|uniref:BspA family leucine-rich repeat surface protein n=1 Tax=Mycoplasma mycoides TaxID=2102 RepID=UPI0027352B2C|nr:BspA family leucine-rich repeat surface protein [Mycoplasma mycoides]MDP4040348.1 BspA family leucine-rich repeat surface protein [Mycoplasma mycoides]MDP4041214.1 BspA family leucine-rich repeat surface protein [Mycoplasma mycoides]MDP4042111.1 BspA family leucine-rich repeat surface protein [Mycoplasma mycoides]MDP4043513.1 BspA family leucine-rich repeat surface protein [Mycoplasma mycoides]MDP4044381.1 BspA family leucine-rich repeat surface protein [Mycoplasma mycoides]
MKHLLKIISSLTVLSTSVLAVSCTNKSEQNNKDKDRLPNNKNNTENKDKKEEKDQPQADQPKEEPKIQISEEEKQEVIDALQKVFKEQEDAFGSFHTHQEVLDQLKVYLNDNKIKHLDHLKLTNQNERNTNLKVDTEHKKLNNISLSFSDRKIIFTPNTVLKDKVQTKYSNSGKNITQIGYELETTIKSIKLTQVNKNTTKVPLHLPLKINSLNESFSNLESTKIDNLDKWNTQNIKFLTKTFENAKNFDQSLASWDVSNVFDMTEAFAGTSKFNQNMNSWDVSRVKIMKGVFWDAENFNGDISKWNTKNVEDMDVMFSGAKKFNQDLSSWDVSKVQSMKGMFSSTSAFNSNISKWNTSNVATMEQMFQEAKGFNQDLGGWNVEKVTHAENFNKDGNKDFVEKKFPKFKPGTAK